MNGPWACTLTLDIYRSNGAPMIHSHPLFSMIIIAIATRPVVIVLHELGHVIAARLFARQQVAIYLGSYGNQESSANITVRWLTIWFTSNPFLWQRGLCVPSVPITKVNHRISYLLAAPILPVAIAAIVADAAFVFHFGEYARFISFVFFGVAILDMIVNLIPYGNPIAHHNGEGVFTDGYLLRLAFLQKKYPVEFFTAISQYSKHQYNDAARNFERALRRMPGNKIIRRNLEASHRKIIESRAEVFGPAS
jgi:hypothetical protein